MTDRPEDPISAAADALIERCVNTVVAGRGARPSDGEAGPRRSSPAADLAAEEEGFETFLRTWMARRLPREKRTT